MFKNLQKALKEIEKKTQITVPIEDDAEGFLDRECPSEKCLFQFKVHGEDWQGLSDSETVFCPSCRHTAHGKSWYTQAQIDGARECALGTITNTMNKAMRADAAASKRKANRNSFLSITLEARGGQDAILVPLTAAEPMRLRTVCEECSCRYSFVGAAYFCPRCGANSARHTFSQTLTTIRTAANLEDTLRASLSKDEAEVMIRTLLEKAMQDNVTSFQRLNEQLYEQRAGNKARRNAFQNLEAGSKLWEETIGIDYSKIIDPAKLTKLQMYFQQRHLLAHQQGIVDEDYIKRSGDPSYQAGQRLSIAKAAVLEFADLVEELGVGLLEQSPPLEKSASEAKD